MKSSIVIKKYSLQWINHEKTLSVVPSSFEQVFVESVSRFAILVISRVPGGGLLPYMGYIGMCGPKGYGFSAVLVINRVSILADFGHFGHK